MSDPGYVTDREDIFKMLLDQKWFVGFVRSQYDAVYCQAKLQGVISEPRIVQAYDFWMEDIARVPKREWGGGQLDHFKQCGHLSYWLRRQSPITEANRLQSMVQTLGADYVVGDKFQSDLILKYANEFLPFDLGYRICRFFEARRKNVRIDSLNLDEDFIRTVCHFLKAKNVSPHAMFLIYKSLFFDLGAHD